MARKPAQPGRGVKRTTASKGRRDTKERASSRSVRGTKAGTPVGAKGGAAPRRRVTKAAPSSRGSRSPSIDVMALHDELIQELSGHQEAVLDDFRAKLEALEHEVATLRDEVTRLSSTGEQADEETPPSSEE